MDIYLIAAASAILLAFALKDMQRQIIPNKWIMIAAPLAAMASIFWSEALRQPIFYFEQYDRVFSVAIDALLAQNLEYAFIFLLAKLTRGDIGGGDAKLAMLIGLITGVRMLVPALAIGLAAGALITYAREKPTPLAPFLAASTIGTLLFCIFGGNGA